MSADTPAPDRAEIARALAILHGPEEIIELRALHQRGRKRTIAGYYDPDHRSELVEQAVRLNADGAAVYVVMNPLDPQLLARYNNRTEDYAQATATDANVTRRHKLLIDIDPQRPRDTSATKEQLEAAMDRARKIYGFLSERNWPAPVVAESGNGAHLIYAIDLPNDEPSRDLIKHCLEALAARFDDGAVKVDKSVFNAARLVKLHGTVANKGDGTPQAPWRLSKLLTVPGDMHPVPVGLLRDLAAEAQPTEKPNGHDRTASSARAWTEADVAGFLSRAGLEAAGPDPHDGALRWKLKRCPFNPEHVDGAAAVFMKPDGRLGFKCQHNSCADKHWADLRALVDGPRESRRSLSEATTRPQSDLPPWLDDGPPPDDTLRPRASSTAATALRDAPLLALLWFATLHDYVPAEQIVKGLLLAGSLFVVYGESNSGKTFFVLDLALAIAAGYPWRGRRTKRGLVIYVAGEGAASVRARVAAYRAQHPEAAGGLPFAIVPQAVNFLEADSVATLVATIKAAESESGEKAALIIVDTFARALPGADENSAQDVGQAVAWADLIRTETGAAVGFVHHAGKDPTKGARGSSALRAATDTEILIEGLAGPRTATVTKQRDLETGDAMPFELVAVQIGTDPEDGQPVTSCTVRHLDASATAAAPVVALRGKAQRQLLLILRNKEREKPGRIWTLTELRTLAREAGMVKQTAWSAVDGLAASPYLRSIGSGYLFTDGKPQT